MDIEFYKNPHINFTIPPPNFEHLSENAWTTLAKAIVTKECGLKKYIEYAKKFKTQENEWKQAYAKYAGDMVGVILEMSLGAMEGTRKGYEIFEFTSRREQEPV